MILRCRLYKLAVGAVATLAACMQQELLMRGVVAGSFQVNALKAVSSVLSSVLVVLVYRERFLTELFERIYKHLHLLVPLDTDVDWRCILRKPGFWLEAVLVFIHLPPGITFEVPVMNWKNFILYRAETLFMIFNTLRVYMVLQCFVDLMLFRLPRRHTVSTFTGVRMNAAFAFKQALNSDAALTYIALCWGVQIILFGYWMRAAEGTACLFGVSEKLADRELPGFMSNTTALHAECQEEYAYTWKYLWDRIFDESYSVPKLNNLYLWEYMWNVFGASIGGLGNIPTTHPSRFVCFIASMNGMIMTGVLTASFTLKFRFTPNETAGMLMLEKEKAVRDGFLFAVKFLQIWFRMKVTRRRALKNPDAKLQALATKMRVSFLSFREAFAEHRKCCAGDIADMLADNVKIDILGDRARYLVEAAQVCQEYTDTKYFPQDYVHERGVREKEEDEGQGGGGGGGGGGASGELKRLCYARGAFMPDGQQTDFEHKQCHAVERAARRAARDAEAAKELKVLDTDTEHTHTHTHTRSVGSSSRTDSLISDAADQKSFYSRKSLAAAGISKEKGDFVAVIKYASALRKSALHHRWRFKREEIERRNGRYSEMAALSGLCGMLCAIALTEQVVLGVHADELSIVGLRAASSISALVTLFCIYKLYWLGLLESRLNNHLRRGAQFEPNVHFWEVILFNGRDSLLLALECVFCAIHMPPYPLGEYEVALETLGNIIVYRLETLACGASLLRIYLIWRPVFYRVLRGFPAKHTIAEFADVRFDSMFVIKWMLNSWHAVYYITGCWVIALFLLSYAFRLSEHMHACLLPRHHHPACEHEKPWIVNGGQYLKENDLYFLNNLWWIGSCIFPGAGAGAAWWRPGTHLGRMCAAVANIFCILLGALLAAVIGNLTVFSPTEDTARGIIRRESGRVAYETAAANIIALWWKKRKSHLSTSKHHNGLQRFVEDMYMYRKDFFQASKLLKVEVEECSSTSAKIDRLLLRTRTVKQLLDRTGFNLMWVLRRCQGQAKGDNASILPPPSLPPNVQRLPS